MPLHADFEKTSGKGGPTYPQGVIAQCIPAHVAPREWVLTSASARRQIHLLALVRGEAIIVLPDGGRTALLAPCLAWLPLASVERLQIPAGTTASLLSISAATCHRYLTPAAETPSEHLLEAEAMLALAAGQTSVDAVAQSIAAVAAELDQPARAGAASILSCELSLCVLRVWRLLGHSTDATSDGNAIEILRRFRRSVEERYREHLPVSAYAQLLGITPDRLHAICTRALNRTPRELIQQRLVQEGSRRLETSGATVKQIAFALGFKDTAYFNRYFRRHTGQPPGKWRRAAASRGDLACASRLANTFADWP